MNDLDGIAHSSNSRMVFVWFLVEPTNQLTTFFSVSVKVILWFSARHSLLQHGLASMKWTKTMLKCRDEPGATFARQ